MTAAFWIWMVIILKIPVIAALWIVWWAVHEEPVVDEGADGGGGARRPRHPPLPRHPRPPRRGPHAATPPRSPSRVRVARGRTLEPSHR